MYTRFTSVIMVVAGLLTCPAPSLAEENGFKIGDGRLHPFFDLETRYDSAAQLALDNNNQAKGAGDFVLHFRPGLRLSVPSPYVSVDLAGQVEYLVYTGLSNKSSRDLDRFQGEGNLDIGILQGSPVSFDLGDHLTRSDQTANIGLTAGVLSLYNDARASATIAPGGGSLTITPGYHLSLENFSPLVNVTGTTTTFNPNALNYLDQRITLENRWRFLPKTAVLLDGEYAFRSYTNNVAGVNNIPIQYLKISTGVAGLITPHISTIARIGYGRDMTQVSFNSVIGQLEGAYLPNETSAIRLGVIRTFEPVAAPYVSFDDNRAYLGGKALFFGRLTAHAYAAVDYIDFRTASDIARSDLLFTLDGGLDFEAFRWLILSGGDTFTNRSSDDKTPTLNFSDDQVYIRLTFIY